MKTTRYGICPICGSCCGLTVEIENNAVTKITGDNDDPHSRGYICPKGASLKYQHEDPDRILNPLRRDGGSWTEVSWDSALDDIARRFADILKRHGRDAVAVYAGDGATHSYETLFSIAALVAALGIKNLYTSNSMDALPRLLASELLYGNSGMLPIPDVERTDYLLILGANPVVSNGSVMSAPGFARYISGIQDRGGKVVVIDPRKNETALKADEHFFIRPEMDVVLLLALMNVIFEERLDSPGALKKHMKGYETIRRRARDFTPERAAAITGIPAPEIRRIAHEFSSAPSAVCYGRMGACAQVFGTTASMLIDILNIITGNLDRAGGAMFTTPALDLSSIMGVLGAGGSYAKNRTRVAGLPDFNGEMPCAALADEIEAPDGIRALIVIGGNPLVSVPNTGRLARAFDSLELMVSIDPHVNATSCHAHYILPPAVGLEHEIYPLMAYATAVHNVAKWAPPVLVPPPTVKYDAEIIGELICRVIGSSSPAPRMVTGGLMALGEGLKGENILKLLIATGPHGRASRILGTGGKGITLDNLKRNPHGISLGQLEPRLEKLPGRRRINLAPKILYDEFARINEFADRLQGEIGAPDDGSLILTSRRQLRFCNTSLHNIRQLAEGPEQCTLEISPADAAARSIKNGDTAVIETGNGTVETAAEVTDRLMPGVVSLPFGWNGPQPGAKQEVLNNRPGINVNLITDQSRIDPVSAMTAFNGTKVRVSKKN